MTTSEGAKRRGGALPAEAVGSRPLGDRLAAIAPFVVGYGCLDAWGQMVSASVLTSTPVFDQILKYAFALVPPLVLLLFCFRIAPLVRRRHREAIYLFGFAGTLGTFALYLVLDASLSSEWLSAANVLTGVARCFLLICWWERLTALRRADMWLAIGGAIVLGAVISLTTELFPANAEYIFYAFLPLVSTFFLQVRHREGAVEGADHRSERPRGGEGAPGLALGLRQAWAAVPFLLIIVLGLVNIPSEALVVVEHNEGFGEVGLLAVFMQTLRRMSVNLIALGLAYVATRVNIAATFYVAIPVIVLASTLPALGLEFSIGFLHSVSRIGSEMIRYVIVYMLFGIVLERRVPALFCYSLMVLFHCAGTLVGLFVALVLGHSGAPLALVFLMVLIVVMLLVMGAQQRGEFALGCSSTPRQDPQVGAKASSEEAAEHLAPQLEELLEAFAARYHLTRRERDVMELWVKGYTTAYIEEQLCVSKSTVKTHVNHIYEKTGANSKEALIMLFDGFCKRD